MTTSNSTRAALVGVDFGKGDFAASLEELSLLSRSAGAEPVRPLTTIPHAYSHRRHVYHAYLFETERETRPSAEAISRAGWTTAAWERPDPDGRALSAAQRRIARSLAAIVTC